MGVDLAEAGELEGRVGCFLSGPPLRFFLGEEERAKRVGEEAVEEEDLSFRKEKRLDMEDWLFDFFLFMVGVAGCEHDEPNKLINHHQKLCGQFSALNPRLFFLESLFDASTDLVFSITKNDKPQAHSAENTA